MFGSKIPPIQSNTPQSLPKPNISILTFHQQNRQKQLKLPEYCTTDNIKRMKLIRSTYFTIIDTNKG